MVSKSTKTGESAALPLPKPESLFKVLSEPGRSHLNLSLFFSGEVYWNKDRNFLKEKILVSGENSVWVTRKITYNRGGALYKRNCVTLR